MSDWFRFAARVEFRVSPGPGWVWPQVPAGVVDMPDAPSPGWPTTEYVQMQAAVNTALLRGGPTLNYVDLEGTPRSLVVRDVRVELPVGVDESGTALTPGSVEFEAPCFLPSPEGGPGPVLGAWLAWVDVEYGQGRAAFQALVLDSLVLVAADGPENEGEISCAVTGGGALFVRQSPQV